MDYRRRFFPAQSTAAVLSALLLLLISGSATAITTDKTEYLVGAGAEYVAVQEVSDPANRLTIYQLAFQDTRFCQTTLQEITEIGNLRLVCEGSEHVFEAGMYSIMEHAHQGLPCNFLNYEQCKAHPAFISEAIFSIVEPVTASSGGGGGGGGPTAYRPEITVTSPGKNQEFSNFVSIQYEATDKNDIAEKSTLGLSSKPVSLYYSETSDIRRRFLIAKDLPSSGTYVWDARNIPESDTYYVSAEAVDLVGEVGVVVSPPFAIDHVMPVLTTNPTPLVTRGEDVLIRVTSSRPFRDAPIVSVRQRGFSDVPVVMTGTSTEYSGTYKIVPGYDGTASIAVQGWDLFGNAATTSLGTTRFAVGVEPPPKPEIIDPIGSESVIASHLSTVSVTARIRPDTSARLSINGREGASMDPREDGIVTFANVPLDTAFQGGRNTISITAHDPGGNVSEPAVAVFISQFAPELRIVSPSAGDVVTGSREVVISAADKNRDKLLFTYEISGDKGTTWELLAEKKPEKRFLFDPGAFADGEYQIRATAFDGTFSTIALSDVFEVRNSAPRISFTDRGSLRTNSTAVSFSGTALVSVNSDATAITAVEYRLGESGDWLSALPAGFVPTARAAFSVSLTVPEGIHSVFVKATDDRDLSGVAQKVVVVDFGPPDPPSVTTPSLGTIIRSSMDINPSQEGIQIVLTGAAEPGSTVLVSAGAVSLEGRADDSGLYSISGITIHPRGTTTLALIARDVAGNESASRSVSFFANNPPIISIREPKEGYAVGRRAVIRVSASDPDGDTLAPLTVSYAPPRSSTYSVIGTATSSGAILWDTSGLPEVSGYTLRAETSDGTDAARATRVVALDLTPPMVTLDELSDTTVTKEFTLRITGTARDALSGVAAVEYSIDGERWFTSPLSGRHLAKTVSFAATNPFILSDGVYTLRVRAVDAAENNSSEARARLTVDTTPPRAGSFMLSYSSRPLFPLGGMFRVPIGVPLSVTLSLESDTSEAALLVGEIEYPLSRSASSGLWTGEIVPEFLGTTSLAVLARDMSGNSTNSGAEIASLLVIPRGSVVAAGEPGAGPIPIQGAIVTVSSYDEQQRLYVPWMNGTGDSPVRITTDERGEYLLLFPRGRYIVHVEKEGFSAFTSEEISLGTAQFFTQEMPLSPQGSGSSILGRFLKSFTE